DVAILSTSVITTRMNLGGGVFSAPISIPHTALYNRRELTLVDLDLDGDLDALTSGMHYYGVHLNPGNGTLGPEIVLSTTADYCIPQVARKKGERTPDLRRAE